jgi:Uncharacterized conserved protein
MKEQIGRLYNKTQDYLVIIFGTLIFGFGLNAFIISNGIVVGGVSGICSLIFFSTGIPVSVSYFLINLMLLVIAFKVLGFKFLIKTIIGVISLSLSLSLFELILQGQPLLANEPFMSVLVGGGICGLGLGIIFSANGSTGGTDIIAAIINKHKNISMGTALLICDFFIIGSSYILFQDVEKIVFGFVEMGVSNYVIDLIINSNRQSVQFFIFSKKHNEIAKRVFLDLNRGCTFLDGHGGYSNEPIKVVVLVARKSESLIIFRLVKDVDPNAFISQSIVRGVYGEGFDQIKT